MQTGTTKALKAGGAVSILAGFLYVALWVARVVTFEGGRLVDHVNPAWFASLAVTFAALVVSGCVMVALGHLLSRD